MDVAVVSDVDGHVSGSPEDVAGRSVRNWHLASEGGLVFGVARDGDTRLPVAVLREP